MLVFDLESDGLLDTITRVHCINAIHRASGEEFRFTDHEFYQNLDGSYSDIRVPRSGTIKDGLKLLSDSACIGGQNIIDYDIPALKLVYPDWSPKPGAKIRDTKTMSRVMYTNLKDLDFAAIRKGKLPGDFPARGLIGTHKLEAWGLRIGKQLKGDFKPGDYIDPRTGEPHTWATIPFTKDMDDYCMQDVRTNVDVFEHFESKGYSEECFEIEHAVAQIIHRQERYGFMFDVEAAEQLAKDLLLRKLELEEQLRATIKPFYVRDGARTFTPKRDNKRMGYLAGAEMTKVKLVEFNPGSRDQIADRLMKLHGWVPTEFTPKGRPKVDEAMLKGLTHPEAKLIAEYLKTEKRLGQLAEGRNAWLKKVKADGRIHGKVNSNGTVTGRMSHHDPNVAQADKDKRMRALWIVPEGYRLVGCDADALELRCLAHFLAPFDGGEYVRVVLEGKKEDGSDMHSRNRDSVGLRSRDVAKVIFYAFCYGAGDYKLGTIYLEDLTDEKRDNFFAKFPAGKKRDAAITRLGKRCRDRLVAGITGMDELLKRVKKAARRGWLKGLDGRKLHVRSEHAALNTLLQSAGAVVLKRALVLLDNELQACGLTPGDEYEFTLNCHDEWQLEVKEEFAEQVGREAADSMRKAGESFSFRCPLAGSYDIGANWSCTH